MKSILVIGNFWLLEIIGIFNFYFRGYLVQFFCVIGVNIKVQKS